MQINDISLNEELRLQELYSYNILDSAPEKEFDDLVELAAQIYGCPMAAISFVDKNRQWLKAEIGIGLRETNRDISFCSHAIDQNKVMIVKDATLDSRFLNNPLVTSDPSIRFYAGAPIISARGLNLGTVCILDQEPRTINDEQVKSLAIISRQIAKLLELRLKNSLLKIHAENRIQNQKDLIEKTMLAQEEERFDISTELHENIAQGLAATKLYLDMADANTSFPYLEKCKKNVAKIIDQTRNLSKKLVPSTLKSTPLTELLDMLLAQLEKGTCCAAEISFIKIENIPASYNTILFRIVQEQLKNVLKHSKATRVKIVVEAREGINLLIEDNGIGIDFQNFKKGYGISKIVMLAEFYNGKVDLKNSPDGGCQLTIFIPPILLRTNNTSKLKLEGQA